MYMPGKDIGHIKNEYTCSVRILNTYREHISGKDIRHIPERDRPKMTLTKVSKYTCPVRILDT